MSKTVSFRASEELDEFLEKEAERRMTTKSTVAQMLLAERVRELQDERSGSTADPEPEESGPEGELPAIFQQCENKWYVPDSQKGYKFAVVTADGEKMYYKTERGAEDRLRQEYGG